MFKINLSVLVKKKIQHRICTHLKEYTQELPNYFN